MARGRQVCRRCCDLDPAGGVDDDLVLAVAKFQTEQGIDKLGKQPKLK
jgi:hypothetical protein